MGRSEAKDLTRRRVVRAALAVLDRDGEAGLTTVRVAKEAGIAQSSFYVHFKDKQDLLRTIGEEGGERLRTSMREARRKAREAPTDEERHRDTFRVPLEAICKHPELLRVLLRARHDSSSPLQEFAIRASATYRDHLATDLAALGYASDDERSRRRLQMIAESMVTLTTTMAMGHLEGRYPDLEETVDVLVAFSKGYLRLLKERSSAGRSPLTPPLPEPR